MFRLSNLLRNVYQITKASLLNTYMHHINDVIADTLPSDLPLQHAFSDT